MKCNDSVIASALLSKVAESIDGKRLIRCTYRANPKDRCGCVIGQLEALGGRDSSATALAYHALYASVGGTVERWIDSPDRTASEVAMVLRRAARELRN